MKLFKVADFHSKQLGSHFKIDEKNLEIDWKKTWRIARRWGITQTRDSSSLWNRADVTISPKTGPVVSVAAQKTWCPPISWKLTVKTWRNPGILSVRKSGNPVWAGIILSPADLAPQNIIGNHCSCSTGNIASNKRVGSLEAVTTRTLLWLKLLVMQLQ